MHIPAIQMNLKNHERKLRFFNGRDAQPFVFFRFLPVHSVDLYSFCGKCDNSVSGAQEFRWPTPVVTMSRSVPHNFYDDCSDSNNC